MTEATIFRATVLPSALVLFAVFAWLPVMRGARAFFGVRVEIDYFEGAGRRVLTRYRLALVALFLAIFGIAAVLTGFVSEIAILIPAELVLAFAPFVLYVRFAKKVRPHASAGGATRFASSMRSRSAEDRPWVEAVVATCAALTFVVPALSYNELPARIPIHWNAAGQVDRWTDRNIFTIFFVPTLVVYLQVFLYILRRDLGGAKMTLPADCTEEYLQGKQKFLQTNVDTLDWTRLMIAVLFCNISLLQMSTAVARLRTWEPVARTIVFGGVIVLLAGIVFLLVRMMRINARLRQQAGEDFAQRSADERHWIHGGLTYSNPDDPALVVEKLVGLGYTVNMAHPGLRSRMWLIAGIPLFVIWAVLAM